MVGDTFGSSVGRSVGTSDISSSTSSEDDGDCELAGVVEADDVGDVDGFLVLALVGISVGETTIGMYVGSCVGLEEGSEEGLKVG